MMNRRGFLGAILAAFVAPDPERLLWVPGKKLISIPSSGNQILTPEIVATEMLQLLRNHMVLVPRKYAMSVGFPYKIGSTINVRRPMRFKL